MASKNQRRRKTAGRRKSKPKPKSLPSAAALLGKQGLVANPNSDLAPKRPIPKAAQTSEWTASEEKPSKRRCISNFDQSYVNRLHEKYGVNYEAMARDVKLNYDQWTASKIEKCYKMMLDQDV